MPDTPRQWLDRFCACFQHHRPEFSARDAQQIAADAYRVGFELEPEQVAMFVAAQPAATLRNRPAKPNPRTKLLTRSSSFSRPRR